MIPACRSALRETNVPAPAGSHLLRGCRPFSAAFGLALLRNARLRSAIASNRCRSSAFQADLSTPNWGVFRALRTHRGRRFCCWEPWFHKGKRAMQRRPCSPSIHRLFERQFSILHDCYAHHITQNKAFPYGEGGCPRAQERLFHAERCGCAACGQTDEVRAAAATSLAILGGFALAPQTPFAAPSFEMTSPKRNQLA